MYFNLGESNELPPRADILVLTTQSRVDHYQEEISRNYPGCKFDIVTTLDDVSCRLGLPKKLLPILLIFDSDSPIPHYTKKDIALRALNRGVPFIFPRRNQE